MGNRAVHRESNTALKEPLHFGVVRSFSPVQPKSLPLVRAFSAFLLKNNFSSVAVNK